MRNGTDVKQSTCAVVEKHLLYRPFKTVIRPGGQNNQSISISVGRSVRERFWNSRVQIWGIALIVKR